MATRASVFKQYATEVEFIVATAGAASRGQGVKFGTTDGTVQNSIAGDPVIGIAMEDKVAGQPVRVCLPFVAIVAVKVGAGGTATRGSVAAAGNAGFTNLTLGGGSTAKAAAGIFLQSGVAGDEVSLGLLPFVGVAT